MQLTDEGPEEQSDGPPALPDWAGTMGRHGRSFASATLGRLEAHGLARGESRPWRIVETASHGNYLQPFFRDLGASTLIAEGAPAWADAAVAAGLDVERRPLDPAAAPALADRLGGGADAMIDYYALAHLRQPDAFLAGVRAALRPGGIAALEFDHLLPVLEEGQFDAIRHGHFSYLSFLSLSAALRRVRLRAFDVEQLPVYGGAVRVWAEDAQARTPATPAVAALLARERTAGLDQPQSYAGYQRTVERIRVALRSFLETARSERRRVAAYGAPTRGNTLLNSCGVGSDLVAFTVDRSPSKQGRFLPGSHIPVLAPTALGEERPDYVLILTWDLADEVQAQLSEIREWGARFVVPIPELKVLP